MSLVAQKVKNLPAVKETWVRSLGWEDPLVKGMATHSSILVWRIPWTEQPGGLQSTGSQRMQAMQENLINLHVLFIPIAFPSFIIDRKVKVLVAQSY